MHRIYISGIYSGFSVLCVCVNGTHILCSLSKFTEPRALRLAARKMSIVLKNAHARWLLLLLLL